MSEAGLDAIVLAGGRGTRIADVYPDLPKPLVPAAGRPFLHWVCAWLAASGVTSLTLSVGYRADQIEAWAQEQAPAFGIPVRCVCEDAPLGTGGAVRLSLKGLGPELLVCNGDSMVLVDLSPAIRQFRSAALDGLIVAVPIDNAERFGSLVVDDASRLRGFHEKRVGAGLINAGVYLLRRSQLERIPPGRPLSLERDVLPSLLRAGARIDVWSADDRPFLDIGTPPSVARASTFIHGGQAFLEALRRGGAREE